MRRLLLIICLAAFTGVLFAGASFNGITTCISSDVDDVLGAAVNNKKCKSEEACDGLTSCTGDENGVGCGAKGTKYGCETATTKCCKPKSSGTVWGTVYTCQNETCTAGSSTEDCGTHNRECDNH